MASYPDLDTIAILSPLGQQMQFKTLTSQFEELGTETRKKKWLYPRRNLRVSYQWLSLADARTLWQFYQSRGGRYEAFSFFYAYSDTYVGEYVGSGDGSTLVFNMPSKNAGSRTLYVDGVSQTEGVDWTFTASGGADGADKATFGAAPSDGARITFDFTGRLKVRCRFMEDIQDFETFFRLLTHMGVAMKGLLNG